MVPNPYPNNFQHPPPATRWWLRLCLILLVSSAGSAGSAAAQTMARRGWEGAGAAAEPWWHRAVFYRIDPARFQAIGNGTTGDLAGIALRLDYLQSLGVDALVLEPALQSAPATIPTANGSFDPDALESLIREASQHHLRILPSLTPALENGDRTQLLQTVHDWLAEGAAGIAVPEPPPGTAATDADASLLARLAELLHSIPGDRVLLTSSASTAHVSNPPAPASSERRFQTLAGRNRAAPGAGSGQLITAALLPSAPATAAALRSALLTLTSGAGSSSGSPLLRLVPPPRAGGGPGATVDPPDRNAVAAAAALLASRSAALFSFGAEIGLDTTPQGDPAAPLMQWTPANVRQAPVERPEAPVAPLAPGQPTPFGAYKPFVRPPPRSLIGNVPTGPLVELDRNLPPSPPGLGTLPGFTAGVLPSAPIEGATLNVATQERDPRSILNAFRELLALHRGNPALREGTQIILHPNAAPSGDQAHASDNALVFLRCAPAAARTAGTVVVAANLGDSPLVLSLNSELPSLGLHAGPLRALFSYGPQVLTGESTSALRLPPHAVFVGEFRPAGQVR